MKWNIWLIEYKINREIVSSGERKRISLNYFNMIVYQNRKTIANTALVFINNSL